MFYYVVNDGDVIGNLSVVLDLKAFNEKSPNKRCISLAKKKFIGFVN